MMEDPFGRGRSADIPGTDEQDFHSGDDFLQGIRLITIRPMSDISIPRGAHIVILTGAGISKESGLDTFRDADGIWSQVRWQDVATPEAFARDPDKVHAFYNMRRARNRSLDLQPNVAHRALAKLEAEWPGEVLIVTQNVDTLHERAGTKNLLHMHGLHAQARCNHCGHVVEWSGDMSMGTICEGCTQAGGMRPNVVWFGETPMYLDQIADALQDCDLFVSIGTSGNVYPAAGVFQVVRLGVTADQQHQFDLLQQRKDAGMPRGAAFGPRRQIAALGVAPGIAEAHAHHREQGFVVKFIAVDAHPSAQLITGAVVERQAADMGFGARRLADDQDFGTGRAAHHRTGAQWQIGRANRAGARLLKNRGEFAHMFFKSQST
jgi:NAD-dependent deacetylase